ncbi:MAG TPA: helix-turn-helix transcriptional regulator [Kribbellaceae bacterium]
MRFLEDPAADHGGTPAADAADRAASLALLGRTIGDERGRALIPQRTLAKWSGVLQQSISAYERGRMTPSWATFVRLLAAMDRRPVLTTAPTETSRELVGRTAEFRLETALAYALEAIGKRRYRVEGDAAAHLHGEEDVLLDELVMWVFGEAGELDRLAEDVARALEVNTVRAPRLRPHLSFTVQYVTVLIVVTDEQLPAVDIAMSGVCLKVAPAGDIRYRRPV